MPYIDQQARREIDSKERLRKTAGELNYEITQICREYFYAQGGRYQQINDIIGALEGCKLEFYRRLAVPYEDIKIKQNSDVY